MLTLESRTATAAELVVAAREGQADAYGELVRRYESLIRSVARSHRLSDADAHDVIQVTWLRLIENIGQINDPARVAGWLSTTARRECLRLKMRQSREVADPYGCLVNITDPMAASPEGHAVRTVTAGELRKHVERLPARAQTLLWALFDQEAPHYRDISRRTGMPIGSIGPTRARWLARLRRQLEGAGLCQAAWE